jgi:hypothetical protein
MARSWGEAWARVRRSVAVGRAFDRGMLAARDGDQAQVEAGVEELRQLGASLHSRRLARQAPLSPAEAELVRALQASARVERAPEDKKAALQEQEAKAYRRALEIAEKNGGEFTSSDPQMLNALGYFLADKGTSHKDFERAEKLTLRALPLHDAIVRDAEPYGEASVLYARFARANTRDSLAWARYKLATVGKGATEESRRWLEQARRDQEAAVDEARQVVHLWENAGLDKGAGGQALSISPELLFHLAVILREQNVQGVAGDRDAREGRAISLLREALKLDPKYLPAQQALDSRLPAGTSST